MFNISNVQRLYFKNFTQTSKQSLNFSHASSTATARLATDGRVPGGNLRNAARGGDQHEPNLLRSSGCCSREMQDRRIERKIGPDRGGSDQFAACAEAASRPWTVSHYSWAQHEIPIRDGPYTVREASFGCSNPARNGLQSGRNEVARFVTRSGLKPSFVLDDPEWKRARFGLLPLHSGPVSFPTSHPPDPIRIDAPARSWAMAHGEGQATACEATVQRHGGALTARFQGEDDTASPVIPSLSPSCSSSLPPLGFLDLGSPFIIPRPSEAFLLIDSTMPLMSLFVFEFSFSSVARCHQISPQRRRPCRCGRRRHAARRRGPLLRVRRLEAAAAPAAAGPSVGFFPGCTNSTSDAGSGRPR